MRIYGYDTNVLVKRTLAETWDDGVLGLAAQAAYSFFFSLFPVLLFLAPLFSLIGDKREFVGIILSRLQSALPVDAFILLRGVVTDVVFAENAPGLMSAGILLALFTGSAAIDTLMGALNTAYDVHDPRSFWKKRLIAIGFTIVAGIVIGFATLVLVGGETVVHVVAQFARIPGDTERFWTIAQYPVAFGLLTGFIWLLFYSLPYARQQKSHVLVGAVVTVVLWTLITLLFRWYVANFASYNRTYGTIGGVIILLTWMYWSMAAILTGGELTSELRAGTGNLNKPPTRLPADGLRDAVIAERARF
ncbi:MAG: YihY/virulence factor BrkB family protein [Gemmatimonadaceae bacterium]